MRDNNFNKRQLRGIDIAVSAAKKKFPYINGWEFYDGFEKYDTTLYILINVDFLKVAEMYNTKINKYYINRFKELPNYAYSTPLSVLDINFEFGGNEWNEVIEKNNKIHREIKSQIEFNYNQLPDEFAIFYTTSSFPDRPSRVTLSVDGYIAKNSN